MILAIGAGVAVYFTQTYAVQTIKQYAPEILMYGYFPVGKNFLLRPGIRLNYSWENPESPQAIKVIETDFRYLAELGVVYNWIVMPSLSVGGGNDYRKIHLKTKIPIFVPTNHVSSSETFPLLYFQCGLGFPLLKGFIVIEPYLRYTILQHETKNALGYGIEATLQIL